MLSIPIFIGITMLVYFLASFAQESPLYAFMSDPRITEEELARKAIELGLDKPVYIQYLAWFKNILSGDFGYSYHGKKLVIGMISERVLPSVLLACSALVFSLIISFLIAIASVLKPKSLFSRIAAFITGFIISTPNFFIGLVLIYIISLKLKWLPSSGMYSAGKDKTISDLALHMLLPCLVLSANLIGNFTRQLKTQLSECMQEEYIKMARAKGLSREKALMYHALRNALLPMVSLVNLSIPSLIGSSVVTEKLFSWQGLGSLMINAINDRDYPVLMALTVIIAVTVLILNIVSDFLYAYLDPRIRYK